MEKTDLRELLRYIDPAACSYREWCNVGMALKHEGYSASDWEEWSSRDSRRYHQGECARKWNSFHEASADIVTGGTIFQMAVEGGYSPDYGRELDWDDEIDMQGVVVNPGWLEGREFKEPAKWHPGKEVARYLETLFEPGETVGYVMTSREDADRGKFIPSNRGIYNKTAGKLLEELAACGDDIGAALGDYNPKAGAWIRFNPLDGSGVQNKNVTEYRYALVESDDLELEKQNSIIRELELPVAVLMYSGGKSLHAIVKIDAADYREYQKRVEYLYEICAKNGLKVDTQNKNPSRLSRLPGCVRGDKKQYIIDTNIGKSTWNEWQEWIEAVNDNLPDIENLEDVWGNMPELAEPLIEGILRKGHKMLIAGPSKAGKSFLQIELAIAIAEGSRWLGRKCAKGKVMYVNLEVDRASCLHRFKNVYDALHLKPENLHNIDMWHLRGKSVPLDKLAPKLIRRAQKKNCVAVIIDPIYKVITGDENSAEQMAKFCNQFDKICAELGCAAIYCHHHSKGAQGGKKAMDRASGSGVFARDPDAQIDMIELEPTEALMKRETDRILCSTCKAYLDSHWDWQDDLSDDDLLNPKAILSYCENVLPDWRMNILRNMIAEEQERVRNKTAWRLEATLREFPGFDPINVWFEYPIHRMDVSGALADINPTTEKAPWEKLREKRDEANKKAKEDRVNGFDMAFATVEMDGKPVKAKDLAEAMGKSVKTILGWLSDSSRRVNDIAANYEKYQEEEGGNMYIRRKKTGGSAT